jgi:hypothetical protein
MKGRDGMSFSNLKSDKNFDPIIIEYLKDS